MEYFKLIFEGDSYNQTLTLFYNEILIFQNIADELFTSIYGELQIRLNFLGDKFFFHTLRYSDGFILFIPVIKNIDVNTYLKFAKGLTLTCPLTDLINLWEKLGYDIQELTEIKPIASNELFLIWLISSQYCNIDSLECSNMANALIRNIIAENPDGLPTTKDIIYNLNKGEIFLKNIISFNDRVDSITTYIDEVDGSIIEWKSISNDRKYCLINSNIAIKIIS